MRHYGLTTDEREVIITTNDAERGVLHVFTESRSALATRLLKAARAAGAVVTPTGAGIEFDLPVRAQRREVLASHQKAHLGAGIPGAPGLSAPPAARVVSETGGGASP